MKVITKQFCLIGVLSLLTISAFADGIVGTYSCSRTDATNNATTYPLIVKATGGTYTFEWDNATGYPVMYGNGVMHPKLPNAISVAFWDAKDANNYGIEFFAVKPDGSLASNWAVQSSNQTGTSTCTKK